MDYKVEFIKVNDLKPYENNVKKHDEQQIDQIVNSIKEFGFKQNLVVDKDNVIIIGHGRYFASQKMGLESVPCVRAEGLTDEQIKALRIADNKLADKSVWDNDALADELKAIGENIDMTDFGFGNFELEILTGDFEPDEFVKEETESYDAKEDEYLAKKRIIINFDEEEEGIVKELLGIPSEQNIKVLYDIKELVDVNKQED